MWKSTGSESKKRKRGGVGWGYRRMSELRGPWKSPAFPAFTGRETEQGWDQGHIRMKTCAAVRHWLVFVLLCFFLIRKRRLFCFWLWNCSWYWNWFLSQTTIKLDIIYEKLFSIIIHKQCRVIPKRRENIDEPHNCFDFLPADISGSQSRTGTHAEKVASLSLGDTIRI